MTQMIDFSAWTKATGDLLPGQQRVFLDVLNLVAEGKAHLVHGADYRNGKPCLVNAVGQMLSTGGGQGIPMASFNHVVSEFDRVNQCLLQMGVNTDGMVSPLAAEFLIRNFGDLKPMVVESTVPKEEVAKPYVEPSDEAMQAALDAMTVPGPEVLAERSDPEAEYIRAHVEHPNA